MDAVSAKPDYAKLGLTLIIVRPTTLPMANLVPPSAVTVVAWMRDHRLARDSSEFDTTSADEAERLLVMWLPEQRRRFRRHKLVEEAVGDRIFDELCCGCSTSRD